MKDLQCEIDPVRKGRETKASCLVFDIGCHLGWSTGKFLDLGWRVVGVEANPAITGEFVEIDGFVFLTAAVAEKPGLVEFFVNDAKPDWSSLNREIANRVENGVRKITAAAVTLDMLIDHFGLPDYLKLDIEGGELKALAGLGDHRPAVISFEVDHLGLTINELFSFASDLGYNWYAWAPQNSNTIEFPQEQWRSIDEPTCVPSDWCDLFITRDQTFSFSR